MWEGKPHAAVPPARGGHGLRGVPEGHMGEFPVCRRVSEASVRGADGGALH